MALASKWFYTALPWLYTLARACPGIAHVRSVHRLRLCACITPHLHRRPVTAEKLSGTRLSLNTTSKVPDFFLCAVWLEGRAASVAAR
eukprot:14334453-Alexandrium_andersonii.AAC.1